MARLLSRIFRDPYPPLEELEEDIGYTFKDKELLLEALTHRSMKSDRQDIRHYERLEFLGDTVLRFVWVNYVFKKYPNWDEGQLTQAVDRSVNKRMQSLIAHRLNLLEHIRFHSGVRSNAQDFDGYDDVVESIIGAIYLDAGGEDYGRGYEAAWVFIKKQWSHCGPGVPESRPRMLPYTPQPASFPRDLMGRWDEVGEVRPQLGVLDTLWWWYTVIGQMLLGFILLMIAAAFYSSKPNN